jgi:hypothetical protein
MSKPKPVVQALVLADQIYEDKRTGKKIISGTFNKIWSTKFPTEFSQITWAFLALTEVRGTINLEFQFRREATQDVLAKCPKIPLTSNDPLATCEVVVELPKLPFPAPGSYSFDVLLEQEILGSLRITAAPMAPAEDKQ